MKLFLPILICLTCAGGELSISLRLESEMVMRRGIEHIMEKQCPDGSIGGEAEATAQCMIALRMADNTGEAYKRGIAFLRGTEKSLQVARALLFCEKEHTLADFQMPKEPGEIMWYLDWLGARENRGVTTNANGFEQARKAAISSGVAAYEFAASAMVIAVKMPLLDVENDCETMEQIYWAVRGYIGTDDSSNWRNHIAELLYDRQKSDGGWGNVFDTALVLQILHLIITISK